MEKVFTLSEQTNRLLAIYRDFNCLSKELFSYITDYAAGGDLDKAEDIFKSYDERLKAVSNDLKKLIDIRIEETVLEGDGDLI